jgi:hypothetical protein
VHQFVYRGICGSIQGFPSIGVARTAVGNTFPLKNELMQALMPRQVSGFSWGKLAARHLKRTLHSAFTERTEVHVRHSSFHVEHRFYLGMEIQYAIAVEEEQRDVVLAFRENLSHITAESRVVLTEVLKIRTDSSDGVVRESVLRLGQLRGVEVQLLVSVGWRRSDVTERLERPENRSGSLLLLLVRVRRLMPTVNQGLSI